MISTSLGWEGSLCLREIRDLRALRFSGSVGGWVMRVCAISARAWVRREGVSCVILCWWRKDMDGVVGGWGMKAA